MSFQYIYHSYRSSNGKIYTHTYIYIYVCIHTRESAALLNMPEQCTNIGWYSSIVGYRCLALCPNVLGVGVHSNNRGGKSTLNRNIIKHPQLYIYMDIYIYVNIYIWKYIYIYMDVYIYIYIFGCICIYIHIHMEFCELNNIIHIMYP